MFLDCMYVACCNFYKKREKDIFKISGLLLLLLIFIIHILFIAYFSSNMGFINWSPYKYRVYLIGGNFLFTLPLLCLRYFKVTNYEEINDKLFKKDRKEMNMYLLFASIYIIISIVGALGYVLYKGGQVNGWW